MNNNIIKRKIKKKKRGKNKMQGSMINCLIALIMIIIAYKLINRSKRVI